MPFEELIEALQREKEKARAQGGQDKIEKQHEKGRLTARERIERLLDDGSFLELGALCASDIPGMAEKTPADGLVLGYGKINGRRVGVFANDFTVLAGSSATINNKKMGIFKQQLYAYGFPLIWLGEAGGQRIPDLQDAGRMLFHGVGSDAARPGYSHFRQVPYVMAAMGDCHGVPDWQACLADFTIVVKGASISVSGPRALGKAIGQQHSAEEMGGWQVHAQVTGMADQVAENEEACFRLIKTYLDFMPSNAQELPPKRPIPEGSDARIQKISDILPEKRTRAYDMHKILACIVDGGQYLEIKPLFGKMLITALARVGGETVGIIASNPIVNAGATDTDALEKSTSFLCHCDSFNIPLVFLVDTPGHLTGLEAEQKRVGAKVVNNLQALFQVTVPKITILVRKGYGQALVNMCAAGAGSDFMAAWPTAEISFMDPHVGADIVFGSLPQDEREKLVQKMMADSSPYPAARVYGIQDIIHPCETRDYLIKILGIIRDSKTQGMSRHLLSGWPTKF
ncbi:MAG: carboxyl transferase domain-containing protein [Smithellaceae bacterium]|nr:carboxyl transferase domain-containing protein [Smithellaceae bacterium]